MVEVVVVGVVELRELGGDQGQDGQELWPKYWKGTVDRRIADPDNYLCATQDAVTSS